MADAKKKEESYLKQVMRFYFSPQLRSIGTVVYFGIFGYFTIYYIDNLFLTIRFLLYVLLGHTALSGTAFLLTGMIFVIALLLPFFVSFYSIFVLHRVWDKPNWATYAKWSVTGLILAGSILVIMLSDSVSRSAARRPSMQSFIEDADLTGKL